VKAERHPVGEAVIASGDSGWRQVDGDMGWDRHGVVLAKDDPDAREVHLVRIVPWIEHDSEAAVSHGLYLVDETVIDYDDLDVGQPNLRGALSYVGLGPEEFEALGPDYRAAALAAYSGFEDSRSVNKLAEALPAPPEEIEFWAGKETTDKLSSYDADLRRESLEANFDTRLTFGQLPEADALEFALGGDPFELNLQGQDALAFEYAAIAAGDPGGTDSAEDVAATVSALVAAPSPAESDAAAHDPRLEQILDEWDERYGDPSDEDGGIVATAEALASSIMSTLGFEWI